MHEETSFSADDMSDAMTLLLDRVDSLSEQISTLKTSKRYKKHGAGTSRQHAVARDLAHSTTEEEEEEDATSEGSVADVNDMSSIAAMANSIKEKSPLKFRRFQQRPRS